MNQISRAYIDIEVSKYHKICLGKIIFWPWVLKTFEASFQKLRNWNFWGPQYWAQTGLRWRTLASEVFSTIFSVIYIWLIRFWPTNLMKYKLKQSSTLQLLEISSGCFCSIVWVSPQFPCSIFLTKSCADSSGKVKSNWLASSNIYF